MPTSAPSAAKPSAMARPMPLLDAATNATRPSSPRFMPSMLRSRRHNAVLELGRPVEEEPLTTDQIHDDDHVDGERQRLPHARVADELVDLQRDERRGGQ